MLVVLDVNLNVYLSSDSITTLKHNEQ